MATVSAGLSSLTTVSMMDFYRRIIRTQESEAHYLRASRLLTVLWGVLCTLGALFAKHLGELIVGFNKMNSFFGGVILGIFLLGILTRRANTVGVLAGATVGLLTVSFVGFFTTVSFWWYAVIGCILTFSVGYLMSSVGKKPELWQLTGLVRGVGKAAETVSTAT